MDKKFIFKVIIEDDASSEGYYFERGVGFASNFAEAPSKIQEYYKDSLIEIRELYLSSNKGEIAQIPEEVYAIYKNEDEFIYGTECDVNGIIAEEPDAFELTSTKFKKKLSLT
jgi:hypothetical protein